jgi:energy-converting hydrogenase B subunit D
MTWFGVALMIVVAISGLGVVLTRDVTAQVISLGFYGLLMALVFFYFQAPDVALSQVTVGAVALPLMVMLAISRMKFRSAHGKSSAGGQSGTSSGKGDQHD